MTEIYCSSDSVKIFAKALRIYEKKNFIPHSMKAFYYNIRGSFIQRMFAKEVSAKLTSIEQESKISEQLSLYQLMPTELHQSFAFKAFQNLMNQELGQVLTRNKIRHLLFMTISIEQNTKWVHRLNSEMTECYKKNGDKQALQSMQNFDKSESLLESVVIKCCQQAEDAHDFARDIQTEEERIKREKFAKIQLQVSSFK